MTIGDRIHERRTARNLTMEELGQKVGVGKGTIKKYENGLIKNIPSDKIESLADALETTPEYLMGWTDGEHDSQQAPPHDNPPEPDQPGVKRIISLAHQYPDMPPEMRAYIDGFLDSMFIKLDGQFRKGSAEDDPKL